MSRSIRKVPIIGHTFGTSDKADKVRASKSLRVRNRVELRILETAQDIASEDAAFSRPHEVSSEDFFEKDGKQYVDESRDAMSFIPRLIAEVQEQLEFIDHFGVGAISFAPFRETSTVTRCIALLKLPDYSHESLQKVSLEQIADAARVVYKLEVLSK